MRLGNYFIFRPPESPDSRTHTVPGFHRPSWEPLQGTRCWLTGTGYVVMHGIQRLIGIFGVLFYFGLNCQWVAHAHAHATTLHHRKGVTRQRRWWQTEVVSGKRENGRTIASWELIDWLIDWLLAKVVWLWATLSCEASGWKGWLWAIHRKVTRKLA